jgi:hypothetical protein
MTITCKCTATYPDTAVGARCANCGTVLVPKTVQPKLKTPVPVGEPPANLDAPTAPVAQDSPQANPAVVPPKPRVRNQPAKRKPVAPKKQDKRPDKPAATGSAKAKQPAAKAKPAAKK